MRRGFFISFEGSEGCGKSTQIRLLSDRLERMGEPVILTREPGGTPIGEEIRHLLQFSDSNSAMTPEAELLLFTASRAQLVREVIQPALQRGAIVVADRFLDSTTVYQGVARQIDAAQVKSINQFAVGGCVPDRTFVLDLDPAVASERLAQRRLPDFVTDRMEQEAPSFYEQVRAGYLALAEAEAQRVTVIDAARTVAEIEREIWSGIERALAARTST